MSERPEPWPVLVHKDLSPTVDYVNRVAQVAGKYTLDEPFEVGWGNIGGGLEYRFTPHIGVFGEAGYNWVGGGQHNFNSSVKDFIQVNFGVRFAF